MYAYSFLNLVTTVNGVIVNSFGAGDDVIKIEPAADAATTTWGADGYMVASISANRGGTCTLKLLQMSTGNYVLQQLFNSQLAKGTTFQPISMSVQDALSGASVTCTGGVITKQPAVQYGANAVDMEWVITFENVVINLGTQLQLSNIAPLGATALGGAGIPGLAL